MPATSWCLTLQYHKAPLVFCFSLPLFMLTTSWCLTLWYTLCKSPLVVCFPPFCVTERKSQCNPQRTMDPTPAPTARTKLHRPIDCFQTMQKERIQDTTLLSLLSSPWLWASTIWSQFPVEGRRSPWGTTYCVFSSANLRITAIFLSIFSKLCLHIFWFSSGGKRKPIFWWPQNQKELTKELWHI